MLILVSFRFSSESNTVCVFFVCFFFILFFLKKKTVAKLVDKAKFIFTCLFTHGERKGCNNNNNKTLYLYLN